MKLLLMLIALVSCLAGAVQAASTDKLSVTFINPGGPTQFWGDVAATMQAAAKDLDIELDVIHTDRDRLKMVEAARALAERESLPDYVVLVNELQQAPSMLDALRGTGVPVFVLLNRMSGEQRAHFAASGGDLTRVVASIVPDNEIAGYEMALSLIEEARARGLDEGGVKLLALLGDAATPAALAREAGMRRALSEHPDVTLVRAFPVLWDQETAYERTAAVLQRYDLDAVWAANDQISLGAQRAAVEAGETPGQSIVFAGLNWSAEGLTAVQSGAMTMTHGGHFFAGAWSMVMIRDLADGALPTGAQIEFPMSAVRTGSADRFLDLFGTRDWDAIDFRAFSRAENDAYVFTSEAILKAASQSRADAVATGAARN